MATRTIHQISDSTWFITFTCYGWLPLFDITSSHDLVYNWFKIIKTKYGIHICGFVIMPNHVHLLMYMKNENINLNNVIGNGKRFIAYEIVKRLQHFPSVLVQLANACTAQEKSKGQLHKVFEPSFDAKLVYNYNFFQQKLNYIHHNPVNGKWNLCNEFSDYEHSSASYYLDENQRHQGIITDYRELGWVESF